MTLAAAPGPEGQQRAPDHRNNLDAVRLVAAWLVLFGHSYVLLRLPEPAFLSWSTLGALGVFTFFAISGFLVSQSWERDPNINRFFLRRSLRIFPGLAVCIVLTICVLGPLVTTLPLAEYLIHPATHHYLKNIALYIIYDLPGVFEHNRVVNTTNGSLWSLPIEFSMYVLLAALLLLRLGRWVLVAMAVVFAGVAWFVALPSKELWVIYGSDARQLFICGTYFMVGVVMQKFGVMSWLKPSHSLMALLILICLEPWTNTLSAASWVLLPVLVLGIGFARNEWALKLTSRGDLSYGIYIYAFPVQQAIVSYWPQMPIGRFVLVCSMITCVLAFASWHLVERPALRFKPYRARRPITLPDAALGV